MTNIFGNHGLMFNRFGEEIELDDRLDVVDKVRRTFIFNKSYVSLKGRRLVSVSHSVDPHDCVIKKQLDDLERKLDEKISKLENPELEVVPHLSVIDTSNVNERVSRHLMKKKRNTMDRWN